MRKIVYALSTLIAVLALSLIALWWTAADLDRQIDFRASILASTPNQYLMCPEGHCKDAPHKASPKFQIPRGELERVWDAMMAKKNRFQAPRGG